MGGVSGAQILEGTWDPITESKAKPKCKVPVKGGVLSLLQDHQRGNTGTLWGYTPCTGSQGAQGAEPAEQKVLEESADFR